MKLLALKGQQERQSAPWSRCLKEDHCARHVLHAPCADGKLDLVFRSFVAPFVASFGT